MMTRYILHVGQAPPAPAPQDPFANVPTKVIPWATATPLQKFGIIAFVGVFVVLIFGIAIYASFFGTPMPVVA